MNMSYIRISCIFNKYSPNPRPKHLSALFSTTKTAYAKRDELKPPVPKVPAEHKSRHVTDETYRSFRNRIPVYEREGEWYSAFRLFAPRKGMSPDIIKFLQSPIDLRPAKIRSWWRQKMEDKSIYEQRYIEQRHETLGSDLATAHFVVHRGGSVKFLGQPQWVKKDEEDEYDLPSHYRPDFVIEAIDASKMDIYYEGLVNMENLKKLKWLSFNGCQHIDDWCVDRISGEHQDNLEYLDLSNCPLITERALSAMYRLRKLKTLKLENIVKTETFKLSCLLLEDINPNLSIEGVEHVDVNVERNGS